jgi:hypothetical protein
MNTNGPAEPRASRNGQIFISYHRQETSHVAGRLYDQLADRLGDAQVFMDVDSIEPGVDFAEVITRAVSTCDVLLALIGHQWLLLTDERGRRRLDNADDLVRLSPEHGGGTAQGTGGLRMVFSSCGTILDATKRRDGHR